MKTILKTVGLLCIVTLFFACSQNKGPTPYKITGELISMLPEATEEVAEVEETSTDEAEATDADTPTEEAVDEPIDLSNATLSISYEVTNDDGEVETVSIVEDSFNGSFEYEDETVEPTEVTISLQVSEDAGPMEIDTVIGTGQDIYFALIDHPSTRNDQFILVGTSSSVMHPENEFTVSGDLSYFDVDLTNNTTVHIDASIPDDNGNMIGRRWGPVLVRDNSFHIEGDVAEPLLATLSINGSNRSASSRVILDPKGNYVVTKLGNQTREVSTTSGHGYHAMLIESWQQNEEYIKLVEAWTTERELYFNPPETEEETEIIGDDNTLEDSSDAEVADVEEDAESDPDKTVESDDAAIEMVASVEPAAGCEDAVDGKLDRPAPFTLADGIYPKWVTLQQQALEIRYKALRKVVEQSEDRTAQFIAMKMGPYINDADAVAAWNTLVEKFDADFVAVHITPKLEKREAGMMASNNDSALIPGQKVPMFTLANLEGKEVALNDLLGEKDLVLIDFWASWCGPCIADFPDLKKLYAAYTDEDFEVVGVSIDSKEEAWVAGVEDNELPWVQLGQLESWFGPVSVLYGVQWIPKSYLVDSQGCIYEKDIRPAALKEFLVDRYGMDESLVEPEVEVEDTTELSG